MQTTYAVHSTTAGLLDHVQAVCSLDACYVCILNTPRNNDDSGIMHFDVTTPW